MPAAAAPGAGPGGADAGSVMSDTCNADRTHATTTVPASAVLVMMILDVTLG